MLRDKSTSLFDYLAYIISQNNKKKSRDASQDTRVVFVGEFLPPRIPRMAKWLKRTAPYHFTLLCHERGYVDLYNDPAFDTVVLFRNKWHLKRLLNKEQYDLMHGFAPKSYYCNVARKSANIPYIHDMQDVYATYYGLNPDLRWLKQELPEERDCLEKSDGLIAHCLEANVAMRKYAIRPKPDNLFFPLYADDDFFQTNEKAFQSKEIHLVYAGGVAGSHRNAKQYGNIQFMDLIKILTEQQLHFHIYPSPSNIRADYEEYESIAKENSFFHFHAPVAQQDLAKELSQYDFGMLPFFKELSEQSKDKLDYATTLKLFNYMEAGIPVIVSTDIAYQAWIVKRSKCGICINFEERRTLAGMLSALDYQALKDSVYKARAYWSLKRNVYRLQKFYLKVMNKAVI